ncbi:MAG: hypothetical protein CMF72_24660 [Mameliella sp.]|nr:hypothetical protein [Mameliella sp.]|tara:strand:+ start:524 stop:844 length:321 start_codon:yes stop_codon:yes gene_type:complete
MTMSQEEKWTRRFAGDPGTYAEAVAAEVRVMMTRRGVTQTQLAAALHVTQMYVSRRVKRVDPTPMNVEDLASFASVLECSVLDFLPSEADFSPASTTHRYSLAVAS